MPFHISKLKQKLQSSLLGDDLKARVFRGGAWLGVGSATEQVSRFGRNMLLARILAPEAFGTMAIVLSTTSVITSLTEVGTREGLIQDPRGEEEGHVGAAWWMAFLRALAVYVCLFASASLIAWFYGNKQLTPLLRFAALGVIFEGAISSRACVALKQMKFKKWSMINYGGGITGVVITLILSFFIRDVWALVIGSCSENIARCILSYVICPYLPPLVWSKEAVRDLLRFSKGVFGLSLLNLVFARADIFVLAKLYAPTELGLYAMAVYLIQTPSNFLINVLYQTLMPAFSQIREDNVRMNRILLKATSCTALVGVPALVFLFFCGRSLLTLVYGARYAAAAPALAVASCVALLNVANSQITTLFYAKGLPQLHRRSVALMAILMVVLIYPFAREFGLVGGQLACMAAIILGYIFQVERIGKLTSLNLSQYRKSFLMAAAVSISVVAVCLAARFLNFGAVPLWNIVFGIVGCLVAYGLAGAVFFREREAV